MVKMIADGGDQQYDINSIADCVALATFNKSDFTAVRTEIHKKCQH